MASALKFRTIPALKQHTATVVFSHGLGDTSSGWSFLAEELGKHLPHVKWVFPQAPSQPVSLNMGMPMPSWYDIKTLDASDIYSSSFEDRVADEPGILRSVKSLSDLISNELDETPAVPSSRLVIGGFSQGAVMALCTGLTTERSLAGIACLSGYVPLPSKLPNMATEKSRKLPVFWGHGTADQVVKFAWGEESVELLKNKMKMPNVEFHSYKGLPHSAAPEELEDLKQWLLAVVPPQEP